MLLLYYIEIKIRNSWRRKNGAEIVMHEKRWEYSRSFWLAATVFDLQVNSEIETGTREKVIKRYIWIIYFFFFFVQCRVVYCTLCSKGTIYYLLQFSVAQAFINPESLSNCTSQFATAWFTVDNELHLMLMFLSWFSISRCPVFLLFLPLCRFHNCHWVLVCF